MKGICIAEEICNGLCFIFGEERLGVVVGGGVVAVKEAAEGIWGRGQSHANSQDRQRTIERGKKKKGDVQPNGGGSLSPMAGGRLPLAVAPANNGIERAASLPVLGESLEVVGLGGIEGC